MNRHWYDAVKRDPVFHWHNSSSCKVIVDESRSRRLWHNGRVKHGDRRVELWSWTSHLWADTKGGIVCQDDALRDLMISGGMDEQMASRVVGGNLTDLPPVNRPRP